MKTTWHASKRIKFIVVLGFLIAGTALYYGCGEDTLPPPPPPNTGTITVIMGAV
jgi:hypothetical protein